MAKRSPKEEEGFGNAGYSQMQSPLSFQLNGEGTPEHPCALLTEYPKDKPLMPIADPLSSIKGGQ